MIGGGSASCEINLAWMDGMAGRHDDALRHGHEAIRLAVEVGDRLNPGHRREQPG